MHRPTSAIDVLMFRGEARPRTRTTMIGVYLLDREPPWGDFFAHMDQASRLYPRLRERVVEATTSLIDARWVTDPNFDLSYHVRHVIAPGAGTFRDVLDLVEATLERPLDASRPLWEFTLVGGVDGDRAALISKLSHAVTDGVGGMQLQSVLFDTERDAPAVALAPAPSPVDLKPVDITRAAVGRLPGALTGTAVRVAGRVISDSSRSVTNPRQAVLGTARYLQSLGRVLSKPAHPSPLLAGRSDARRVLWTEFPLDDLKRAGKAKGGTVNDAYLAGLAGALDRYHARLGAPVESVSVAVPVNRRVEGAEAGGNHWVPVSISLPVGRCDTAERMQSIGKALRAARSEPALDLFGSAAPLLSRIPPTILYALLAEFAPRTDVQASNVPGWAIDAYVCGSRVERFLGFGPLPGAAMMVILISNAGNCTVGINYDPAAVERPDVLQTCLDESFEEVLQLGHEFVDVAS